MGANSNTPGTGGLSDFDLLPPRLRAALREFPLCMDAGFALRKLKEGASEESLLAQLHSRASAMSPFNPENAKRGL